MLIYCRAIDNIPSSRSFRPISTCCSRHLFPVSLFVYLRLVTPSTLHFHTPLNHPPTRSDIVICGVVDTPPKNCDTRVVFIMHTPHGGSTVSVMRLHELRPTRVGWRWVRSHTCLVVQKKVTMSPFLSVYLRYVDLWSSGTAVLNREKFMVHAAFLDCSFIAKLLVFT